jgi:hypothetical protein
MNLSPFQLDQRALGLVGRAERSTRRGVMALYGVVAILVVAQIFQFISNYALASALEKQG